MTRRYGRSPRGEKAMATVPHGHWKTSTFIAGLRAGGVVAPMVFDGAMNGEIFRFYIATQLGPTLSPGDVVIMDNLAAHKVSGVRELIEACGATLLSHAISRPPRIDYGDRKSQPIHPIQYVFGSALRI